MLARKARNSIGRLNGKKTVAAPEPSQHDEPAEFEPPRPEAPKAFTEKEVTEKIKELLRQAQEQGHLTYDDINDAIPQEVISAETLDDIYSKLRKLNVEIVESADQIRRKP